MCSSGGFAVTFYAYDEFLAGVYEIDFHMLQTLWGRNLSLTLALLSYWASTRLGMQYHSFLPYDERLRMMVTWLKEQWGEQMSKALVTHVSSPANYFNVVDCLLRVKCLTPKTLWAVMVMYGHKTTILPTLYGINAFDQPAVEFGLKLSLEFEYSEFV